MRSTLAYTTARILLFVAALVVLYLVGARGLLLVALALVVSGVISFVVLYRQRNAMSNSLVSGLTGARGRFRSFGERLDDGAGAEDAEDGERAGSDDEPADAGAAPVRADHAERG